MRRVQVVAGLVSDNAGRILIAKRPDNAHQGGLWEFPGGKCEPGEEPRQALARELREELGIVVGECSPYWQEAHDYPDKSVLLDFWRVTSFSGDPAGMEGQQVRWVARPELSQYDFPAGNRTVVARLLACEEQDTTLEPSSL